MYIQKKSKNINTRPQRGLMIACSLSCENINLCRLSICYLLRKSLVLTKLIGSLINLNQSIFHTKYFNLKNKEMYGENLFSVYYKIKFS